MHREVEVWRTEPVLGFHVGLLVRTPAKTEDVARQCWCAEGRGAFVVTVVQPHRGHFRLVLGSGSPCRPGLALWMLALRAAKVQPGESGCC